MRKTTKINTRVTTTVDGVKEQEFKKVLVQKLVSPKKGCSAMGTRFLKGEVIVHISSDRCTGEVFTLTTNDLLNLENAAPHLSLTRLGNTSGGHR